MASKKKSAKKEPAQHEPAQQVAARSIDGFVIEHEILLDAPRARVFEALTSEIGRWWAYRFQGKGSTVHMELKPGGLFYEDFGGGQFAVFGNVMYLKKPEKLRLAGPLGMSKAVTGSFTFELAERDAQTHLKLTHQVAGFADAETRKSYTGGWNELLGRFLKAWVEEGQRYEQTAAAKAAEKSSAKGEGQAIPVPAVAKEPAGVKEL